LVPGKIKKKASSTEAFFVLTKRILSDLYKEEGELWVAISWAIWFARNKFLHDEIQLPPMQIFSMGSTLVKEFQDICVLKWRTEGLP
jgi:hypothetical protein